jgi:hypothetical protein
MAGFRVQKGHIFGHFPSQPPLVFCRDFIKNTAIYDVYIRFWLTLRMLHTHTNTHTHTLTYTHILSLKQYGRKQPPQPLRARAASAYCGEQKAHAGYRSGFSGFRALGRKPPKKPGQANKDATVQIRYTEARL